MREAPLRGSETHQPLCVRRTLTVAHQRLAGTFKFFATGLYHTVGFVVYLLAFSCASGPKQNEIGGTVLKTVA